jgi:WD40 repeat protein
LYIFNPKAKAMPPLTLTLRKSDTFDLSKSGNVTDFAGLNPTEFFACCDSRRVIRFAIEGSSIACRLVAEADSGCTSMCLVGPLLVVGCEGGQIDIFDLDLMLQTTIQLGAAPVRSVAAISEGRVVAWCHDGSLYLISTADLQKVPIRLEAHKDVILRVVAAPDGEMIATTSADGGCALWGAKGDVRELLRLRVAGNDQWIWDAQFIDVPQGRYLATTGSHRLIRVWECGSGQLVRELGGTDSREAGLTCMARWDV